MEARILSRKIVKPAVPTPDHLRTCKLSLFDQLAPPDHVPIIYFYNRSNLSKIRQQLVKSLSQTLIKFYPLAGRFVQKDFYVDCNDEGVEYVEAEVTNLELGEFLSMAHKNIPLLNDLVTRENFQGSHLFTTPILGLKVSFFRCGGLAIGMFLSHIVADGFTAATFIHEWATTTSALINDQNLVASSPSNFSIASFFPARDLLLTIKPPQIKSSKISVSKIVTRRFVFEEKAISTLKAKVSKTEKINRPTRVEVVTSTIWKALISIGACKSKGGNSSTLYLHLNLRGRTGMAITPDNSSLCGNFYMEVPTKFKESTKNMELHELVNLLRNSLRKALANCSKISSPEGLILEAAKYVNEIHEDMGNDQVDVHLLTTLCRLPLYETDFGWGKPEWITIPWMPLEIVFLLDTKCGTGIEALVSLNEMDMLQFEQDLDIVACAS